MFPSAELLMNHADYLSQFLLIHTLAPPCLHHKIGSGFLAERVVTEERKDARPLRDDRLSFITFPAVVNLAQCAELACYVFLSQTQD
jgi:hypothetical protein